MYCCSCTIASVLMARYKVTLEYPLKMSFRSAQWTVVRRGCMQAKEDVSEAETHDVKFKSADGLILEAVLVVYKVPAAPATWQLRLDEVGAASGHWPESFCAPCVY